MGTQHQSFSSSILSKTFEFIGTVILIAAISIAIAYFFPIHTNHYYNWTGGLWHGIIWFGNWILSFFNDDRLLSAPFHDGSYDWWFYRGHRSWLIYGIVSIIIIITGFICAIVEKKKH